MIHRLQLPDGPFMFFGPEFPLVGAYGPKEGDLHLTPNGDLHTYKDGKPELLINLHRAQVKSPIPPTARSVVQDWACEISYMQQSVLFGIVRGPDGVEKYHPVKPILRWYRRCLLLSAMDGVVLDNPYHPGGGSFTGPSYDRGLAPTTDWEIVMERFVDDFMKTMDAMPIHFFLHMMHAVEIMGFKHSNPRIALWWNKLYIRMVEAMHLYPETREQLDSRLGDTREGWLARSDKAITK